MFLPVTQKFAAKGKAVPTLWRDCSWRVRVFVRTRLGARRPMSINPLLIGRAVAGLPGLKIWRSADAPVRAKKVTGSRTRTSTLLCRPSPVERRRGTSIGKLSACWTRFPTYLGTRKPGLHHAPYRFRATTNIKNRLAGSVSASHRSDSLLQPKGRAPLLSDASERVRPILDFASSQLGGL